MDLIIIPFLYLTGLLMCIVQQKGNLISLSLRRKLNKNHPDILCGKTCYDLPVKEINKLSAKVVATQTGPNGGLTEVNRKTKPFELPDSDVDFIDEDYSESNDSLPCDTLPKNNSLDQSKSFAKDEINHEKSKVECNLSYHSTATLPLGEEIAGINCWEMPNENAYGIATSLYECHPVTKEKAGLWY